jgi:hypothetical protein
MYLSGTAYSHGELRAAMRQFATRTLGTFRDFFEGGFGTSLHEPTDKEVLGLQHIQSGAVYLFDFALSSNYNSVDGDGEYTIVGQLLDQFIDQSSTDYSRILSPDATLGEIIEGPYEDSFAIDVDVTSGVVTLTDTYAQATTAVDGIFLGSLPGHGVMIRDTVDTDLFYIVKVVSVDLTGTILIGEQVGAVNGTVADEVSTLSSHTSARDDIKRVLFPVELITDRVNVAFGAMPASMWTTEITLADARLGFFPRSGRHTFANGVAYLFHGNDDENDDYFHMTLYDPTTTTGKYTHWWMGRVAGSSPALRSTQSAAGMFLGTSGPFTNYSTGSDTYQYLFEAKSATESAENPCILIAPIGESNGAYQHSDHSIYTGASGYSHNFDNGDIDDWVVTSAGDVTLSSKPGAMTLITIGVDPGIERNGLSVAAGTYGVVRFAIRKTQDGDSGNSGEVFFITSGMGGSYTAPDSVSFSEADLERTLGDWWIYKVDMAAAHAPGAGGTDNWTGTLTDLRIDFGQSGTNFGEQYEISWVRVDDGDDSVSDAGLGLIEQYDGGFQSYGPFGSSHDATFGDSTTKELYTKVYSIQAGLNGFHGPLTYGMQNARGRTYHLMRPNGSGEFLGITPTTRNFFNRFVPAYAILHEIPISSVRDSRLGTPIGSTEITKNAEYLSTESYFIFVGRFPGVFRTTQVALNNPVRHIAPGDQTYSCIPVVKNPLVGTDNHMVSPSGDSGRGAYIYPR